LRKCRTVSGSAKNRSKGRKNAVNSGPTVWICSVVMRFPPKIWTVFYLRQLKSHLRCSDKLYSYDYDGELFGCRTKRLSYVVTPNHRLWCKSGAREQYREELAEDAHEKTRVHYTALFPIPEPLDDDFAEPSVINKRWGNPTGNIVIPGDVWASFLGWYMSEGWVSEEPANDGRDVCYRVCVCQDPKVNPQHHAEIAALLNSLPFKWTYNPSNKTFFTRSKQLGLELLKYGKGSGKIRIPRYCFSWSERRLRLLADSYLAGDGNECYGHVKAETTSPGLAEDLVELFGRLGGTGRISKRELSKKNDAWADSYVITFGKGQETEANPRVRADRDRESDPIYFKKKYTGKVYCASVPGEALYVLHNGKPHWSLNSLEEISPIEVFNK
jgi:hypothetical protein